MKIAIDLTELRTSKMGGIEVYCRDLLQDFSVNSRGNEYAVFVPEDEVRNVHYDGLKLVKYKDKLFGKIARISHKLYEQLAKKLWGWRFFYDWFDCWLYYWFYYWFYRYCV